MTSTTDLDAALVERTAKAIGRARILADYPPPEPTISEDGYALYWKQESPEYRDRFLRQAVAALRASELLERVADLEKRISEAKEATRGLQPHWKHYLRDKLDGKP